MNNEKLTQIINEIYKREAYSGDSQELLIEYLIENADIIDDLEDVAGYEVTAWHGGQNFIYFQEAEEYLKKYHNNGYFLQGIVEMINDINDYYNIKITNICDLAQIKLEEEISWLINELIE